MKIASSLRHAGNYLIPARQSGTTRFPAGPTRRNHPGRPSTGAIKCPRVATNNRGRGTTRSTPVVQVNSTVVRRRRGDLLTVPWSQRKPEDFRLSEASTHFTQIGSGQHAGKWKVVIPVPGSKPKVFGPVAWARIDELIARRDALLGEIKAGKVIEYGREIKAPTLREWVPEYLDIVRVVQGRAGKTLENYGYGLKAILPFLGDVRLDHLTREGIEQWMIAA